MDGFVTDVEKAGLGATAEVLAKNMADTLHKHYPGHAWAVNVDPEHGIAKVFNISLSGEQGFMLKISSIQNDPRMRKVMRAGGELLERYRIRRGRSDEEKLAHLETDFRGAHRFDV